MNVFTIEHTRGFDTTVWVQWLTPAGLGVPDIDHFEATLAITYGGTHPDYHLRANSIDTTASAFQFELPNTASMPAGSHAATIDVKDIRPGGTSNISHLIARGVVIVTEPAPALPEV